MRRFRDLNQLREDIKAIMPIHEFIEMADGKRLERVNDELYKKCCDLDEHPVDADGTRDSTPSFTVAPHKELFYCFGCGASGDRFEYLSRKLHIDHIEAINKAAEICWFDLSPYYEDRSPEDELIDGLFRENSIARAIAHKELLENSDALKYLLGRGISMESIEEFELGYAGELVYGEVRMFDSIPNRLALKLDRKDQFNDAILFPVCDTYGRMRYFQSRPFHPLTGQKYLGASDGHPLYEETDRLYGFHIARKKLRKSGGRMVLVEGAPDTIVCNQHGIPTVGALGTAINEKTLALLDKFRVTEAVLLLDGDKAGRDRSIKIAEKYITWDTKVRMKIASMPDGDPDEFINKYGADKMLEIIDNAPYAVQFLLDAKWEDINPITPTGKIEYMAAIEKYMMAVTDNIVRKILINHVSSKLGFDPVEIEDYYLKTATQQTGISLYNPDGEEIILAEALRNPDFAVEMITKFGRDDWYLARHRHLYDLIKSSDHTDVDSLFMQAKNARLETIVTYEWLLRLWDKRGNVEFSVQDINDKLIRRKAREQITRLDIALQDMSRDPSVTIDRSINGLYNTTIKRTDDRTFDSKTQVNDVMALIHERMKNPGQIIGFDLGPNFRRLTRTLLGLQTKALTVVSANQSVGKTQVVQNWAMHFAVECGVPTLWFSLEMDKDRMTFRHLSMLSGVPLTPLLTGNISIEDKINNVDPWAMKLANAPFYLSERGHDLSEALATARRYVIKEKVKVVVIDYAQLQRVSEYRGTQRYQELGIISKEWKQFAKEMDVAVILISQLSKEALSADIAKAEHGAGSYEIAQDSDNYITLKEKTAEEIAQFGIEHGNITLNVDKNRMGDADVLINIFSDKPVQRMMEVA